MKKILPLALFVMGLALLCSVSHAGQAVITWNGPTTCKDGSTLDNCPTVGFNIESSKDGGAWTPVITASPTSVSYTAPNLTPGTWNFRLYTLTLNNTVSASATGDKSKVIPVATPNPPSAVTVN